MFRKTIFASIILAAGKGTRMGGDLPKVLYKVNGKPMIKHVIEASRNVAGDDIVVVVGYKAEAVMKELETEKGLVFALQNEQLGTGHAVKCAIPYIDEKITDVLILFGDVPLIKEKTILSLLDKHKSDGNDITILSAVLDNPHGYGRIVTCSNGNFLRIVEEKDADMNTRTIKEINTGICCVSLEFLSCAIDRIGRNNAQNEFYFTDIIEIGNSEKRKISRYTVDNPLEVTGINTIDQLHALESNIMNLKDTLLQDGSF
jgi:UDP-N-acetylglucosamine diphosphorylase/glucosamine-1-phosphate N-acetyltransferase